MNTLDVPLPSVPAQMARKCASALSALYFGLPVYLVGGALTDPDPRDIDIVVIVPDHVFAAMIDCPVEHLEWWSSSYYTIEPPPHWRRWARDCAKQSEFGTCFCRRRVDFKTQPESFAAREFKDKPRLRIDCGLMPVAKA